MPRHGSASEADTGPPQQALAKMFQLQKQNARLQKEKHRDAKVEAPIIVEGEKDVEVDDGLDQDELGLQFKDADGDSVKLRRIESLGQTRVKGVVQHESGTLDLWLLYLHIDTRNYTFTVGSADSGCAFIGDFAADEDVDTIVRKRDSLFGLNQDDSKQARKKRKRESAEERACASQKQKEAKKDRSDTACKAAPYSKEESKDIWWRCEVRGCTYVVESSKPPCRRSSSKYAHIQMHLKKGELDPVAHRRDHVFVCHQHPGAVPQDASRPLKRLRRVSEAAARASIATDLPP